jgi:hypothetical protein
MVEQKEMSMLSWRFWSVSILFTLGAALLIGIPTVLIPNQFFTRMTPTAWPDYVIWIVTALLVGPIMALAMLFPAMPQQTQRTGGVRAWAGVMLSFFSVGCPICNKIVVLLLGLTGAMTFFNPLRPFLGMASILLLAITLWLRLHVVRSGCPINLAVRQEK